MDNEARQIMTIAKALEQNAEFFGFDLRDVIDIGNGETVEILHREFLDAPTKLKVDQIYKEYDLCDRHTIDVTDPEGKVTKLQGTYKDPREKDGQFFDLEARLGEALWGKEKYERYLAAGGPPGLITVTWSRMRHQINRRLAQDSKS